MIWAVWIAIAKIKKTKNPPNSTQNLHTDVYWFDMSVHFKIHKTKGQKVDTSYGV